MSIKKNKPVVGDIVNATIQHWRTKKTRFVELIYVAEDGCTWRTPDDNSKLSLDWDVIDWVQS